jgi:hypothetical protein
MNEESGLTTEATENETTMNDERRTMNEEPGLTTEITEVPQCLMPYA